MNILISGGTGLIGSALTPVLLAHGHTVSILSRTPEKTGGPAGVRLLGWDGRTPAGWETAVEEADVIINLAGENIGAGPWSPERKRRILNSRVQAGEAICAAVQAARHKPSVLLQASAIGYYGNSDDCSLDEYAPVAGDYLGEICKNWEESTRPLDSLGVRRVVLRIGLVLTPRGGVLERLKLPLALFAGGPLGSGRQVWSWIHGADLVEAIVYLLEKQDANGPYNLTAPQPLSMVEFGKILARRMNRPFWLPVPAFALKLLLGEMSKLVLEGQCALPRRLLEAGYRYRFDTLDAALADILYK